MADVVDKATRSRMMSGIKAKNTKPEIFVRSCLHKRGLRYRVHGKKLPGNPDLFFTNLKVVLFIHGCFWHGHSCKFFKIPKTRTDFWLNKIDGNRRRDAINVEKLNALGWRVGVVWECVVRDQRERFANNHVPVLQAWLLSGFGNIEINLNGIFITHV